MIKYSWASALAAKMLPLVGAHRGASSYAPENTLIAFREAIRLGAHFLELDVHLTKDNIPVVIHDATLDRTTSYQGRVRDFTSSEIKNIGCVPTLGEVLTVGKGSILFNIELKPEDDDRELLARQVIALIEQQNLTDQVLISSFDHPSLPLVKSLAPNIQTGMLYETALADPIFLARQLSVDAIHPDLRLINKALVNQAHTERFAVIPWTVDRPLYIRYLMRLNVAAIITNKPDIALNVLSLS